MILDAKPFPLSEIKYPINIPHELVYENWNGKEDAIVFFKHLNLNDEIEVIRFDEDIQDEKGWDMKVSIKSEDALFSFIHWLFPETRSIEAEIDKDLWIVPIDKEGWHIIELNCVP